MPALEKPKIAIELGMSIESKPSIRALRKRAGKRAELVAAKQPELAFLVEDEFVENAPLVGVDGHYVIEGPLPAVIQPELFPREPLSSILRNDEAEVEAISKALTAIRVSAELLNEVAGLMATSVKVEDHIRHIESTRKVDTGPARSFVYQKQKSFNVTVDGESVTFPGHVVRTAVATGDPLKALVTFLRQPEEGRLMTGLIDVTWGQGLERGARSGGRHKFRFGKLVPWQETLLDLAGRLQVPVLVQIAETQSTCSLKALPIDVLSVGNWPALINMGLAELSLAANDLAIASSRALDEI